VRSRRRRKQAQTLPYDLIEAGLSEPAGDWAPMGIGSLPLSRGAAIDPAEGRGGPAPMSFDSAWPAFERDVARRLRHFHGCFDLVAAVGGSHPHGSSGRGAQHSGEVSLNVGTGEVS
jgi:hypothetical protein